MARHRSADDKFLALLARMPAPMDLMDIAHALNWSRQNARSIGLRLADQLRVVCSQGAPTGGVGRPSLLFALPGAAEIAKPAPCERLEPDTYVVTPTGQEARVIGMRARSFVEFEYVTGPERFTRAQLHIRLLRPFQAGRERPEPVRVRAETERAA